MCLAWLLLKPGPSLHTKYTSDTAYSQQVIISLAQPAIDKRVLGAGQSHQMLCLIGSESVQDAGSMRLKNQTSRMLMLLTKPLAMPSEHKKGCIFFSKQ